MFKKILVALDSSPLRETVLEKAMSMAQAMQARLMLLHVLSVYEEGSPGIPLRSYHAYYPMLDGMSWELYQERWSSFEKQGIEQLQQDIAKANSLGIAAEFTQTGGEPSLVICDVARGWQADLVVVGSRGRSGLSELLMGSVSNYVAHRAPCSVLVVHSGRATDKAEDTSQYAVVS